MDNLKGLVNTYLGLVFKIGVILVILSTLLLFANLTTEFYDTPKFVVLLVFTGILLIFLALKFTFAGKVTFVRTPLDIPLILLLAVAIVSTLLSLSPYVSLLGNQLKVHGSLISIIVYVLFYFILVNSLKSKEVKWILQIAVLGAGVVSVISLLAYAGVKVLPPPWSHGVNFTTTGTSFSTAAILTLFIPFLVSQIIGNTALITKVINASLLTLFGLTIALTGNWVAWVIAPLALALTLFINGFFAKIKHLKPEILVTLIIPVAIVILISILSFIPPIGGAKNPLYDLAKNFPREIQLPFVTSWKVSVSAFRDSPFWGTGPSTYLFNFTSYKPIEYNSSSFWNIRFDNPFNEYLGTLASLGGIGLFALLSLTALFITSSSKILLSKESTESNNHLLKALAVSGIAFFAILALYPSTLALWVIGLLVLASFMVLNSHESTGAWNRGNLKDIFMRVSGGGSSTETIRIDALPSILLVISLALVLVGFYFGGKFALADYYHRNALNAVSQNQLINAYNHLVNAEKLNPYNDLYRTDLAQTNFAIANAIAASKGPTESSPSGSLTDQDQQNIQVLLQQSINEGRTATTLSPRSAINWEILGLLYRQISGVAQNALVFSLDSYGRAIFQDPLNPLLRLNVGGTYYAIQNYDLAIRFFTDAINLKPDFANGYYNLSVALRDKGDLASAQAAAEKVLELLTDKNSEDYKTASAYLEELKKKTSDQAPPAAETDSSLGNEDLPKVIDLPQPKNIATPSAIKKPNSTPEPTPKP